MVKRWYEKTVVIVFCKVIFPLTTIIALLFVSQILDRPILFGFMIADFIARLFLCLVFTSTYFVLPNIEGMFWKIFHAKHWKKEEISPNEKYLYIIMAILYGLFYGVLTFISICFFLPMPLIFVIVITMVNGLIFGIPFVLQYETFKI